MSSMIYDIGRATGSGVVSAVSTLATIPGSLYRLPGFGTLGTLTAGGAALPVFGNAALTFAGFTANGVAAGSVAAGVQSIIGNVAAGSAFAAFQSLGATGGFAMLGPVGLVGAGAAAGGMYLWRSGSGAP